MKAMCNKVDENNIHIKSTGQEYLDYVKRCGLERGTRVKIVKAVVGGDYGFTLSWTHSMYNYIGETYTVDRIANDGIKLMGVPNCWPPQCFELA